MPTEDVTQQRRAEVVCLLFLVVTFLLAVGLFAVSYLTNSLAVQVESLHLLGGTWIWLVLLLVYHQRKLVAIEALESEAVRRDGSHLFDEDEAQLLLMRRRLAWMYRWLLGTAAILLAGWHLIGLAPLGGWSFGKNVWEDVWFPLTGQSLAMALLGGVAFITFLLSRYTNGMAAQREWGMLRAGASYLFGNSLACVGLMAVLGFSKSGNPIPERVACYVITILMLVIGAEFLLNFVLDIYRPRTVGEEPRPAFDSRLLGLFSQPGGIARSIAEAVNYQFGFEVSGTWFYELLHKALVPLFLFAVATQVLMSSFVVVDPGWAAVVERFGKPLRSADGTLLVLGPGLRLKRPWPLDRVYKFRVDEIQEVLIGVSEEGFEEPHAGDVVLWTQEHHGPGAEWNVLVATRSKDIEEADAYETSMVPPAEAATAATTVTAPTSQGSRPRVLNRRVGKSVPVSILRVVMSVQYRVTDLERYAYAYTEVASLLKGIISREMTRYMAQVDLDQIMGRDRGKAMAELWRVIEQRVAEQKLGVEIVHVGFRGVHPPSEVAKEFEAVVAAEQKKEAHQQSAYRRQNEILTSVAGSRSLADRLFSAIGKVEKLERDRPDDKEAIGQAQRRVETLLLGQDGAGGGVLGEAASILNKARARYHELVSNAQAEQYQFMQEQTSYRAAPEYYRRRRWLREFSNVIRDIPKYVLSFVPKNPPYIRIQQEEDELLRFQAFEEEPPEKQ